MNDRSGSLSAALMKPIAHIRSDFSSKIGVPRQAGLVEELRAAVVFEPPCRVPDRFEKHFPIFNF